MRTQTGAFAKPVKVSISKGRRKGKDDGRRKGKDDIERVNVI